MNTAGMRILRRCYRPWRKLSASKLQQGRELQGEGTLQVALRPVRNSNTVVRRCKLHFEDQLAAQQALKTAPLPMVKRLKMNMMEIRTVAV